MKIFVQSFLFTFFLFLTLGWVNATYFESSSQLKVKPPVEVVTTDQVVTTESDVSSNDAPSEQWALSLEYVFIKLTSHLQARDVLNYSKIDLKITGIESWTPFYRSVQKMVLIEVLPNENYYLDSSKKLSAHTFYTLAERIYWINLIQASQIKPLQRRAVTQDDINSLNKIFSVEVKPTVESKPDDKKTNEELLELKKQIFEDVQETLLESHYDKDILDEIKLIESATIGLTKWTEDQFTTYFPPTENKTFMETLDWHFEWIWSYVEMQEPWVLRIVTPIAWSPSEKAGLKWGDQITHADGKEITAEISISEAISWVKWPKWTSVELTILRWNKTLKISVIRDTIVVKNVEHESINTSTYYIKLISFWDNISSEFNDALTQMQKKKFTKKLIIDLRNNPGWYLHEVSDMLSHFVPEWEETVVVKYLSGDRNYYSKWYTEVDFSKYRIIILQNSWSASASEIMAGTIKDYLPETTIIWETSYGKGSVQTIKSYSDGSSLKYTIAKWFTWKSSTWIDWIWVPVDVELEFDFDRYLESKYDNQLEAAKKIK